MLSSQDDENHLEGQSPNTEVLWCAQVPDIESLVMRSQLRWIGHVLHMEDLRLP